MALQLAGFDRLPFWGELAKFMSRTRLQMIRLGASANEAEHVAGEVGRRRQRQGRSRSQGRSRRLRGLFQA